MGRWRHRRQWRLRVGSRARTSVGGRGSHGAVGSRGGGLQQTARRPGHHGTAGPFCPEPPRCCGCSLGASELSFHTEKMPVITTSHRADGLMFVSRLETIDRCT